MSMKLYQNWLKSKKGYSFLTESITFKSVQTKGGRKYYVSGYISTPDIDLYNDVVTQSAMKSMLTQIKNQTIMLDYEHEAWRDDTSIIPVGKIVEARMDNKGLWVKAQLNKDSPKFKDMWGSIKNGFITAFSIAFKPIKAIMKTIGDTEIRLIEDLQLLNVALTGCPVNQAAILTDYGMKAVMMKAIGDFEQSEGSNMTKEDIVKKDEEEVPQPEEAPAKEETQEEAPEAPAEEAKEEAPAEEKGCKENKNKEEEDDEEEDKKVEEKAVADLVAEMKSMAEELKDTKKELAEMKDKLVFKSKAPEQAPAQVEKKNVLDMIR